MSSLLMQDVFIHLFSKHILLAHARGTGDKLQETSSSE